MSDTKNEVRIYGIQRSIWVALHIFGLLSLLLGVSLLYFNDNFKKGLTSINSESYEDSTDFTQILEQDIEYIFDYARFRSLFEENFQFNRDKEMFSISYGPNNSDVVYTVGDVIDYALSTGYYIDKNYQVEYYDGTGIEISQEKYPVNRRSYYIDINMDTPDDGYATIDELAREVLDRLSKYYKAYSELVLRERNIHYKLEYADGYYTNAEDLDENSVLKYGKYISVSSGELNSVTNMASVPANLIYLANRSREFIKGNYSIYIGIDTNFPVEDAYYHSELEYLYQRDAYFFGVIISILGILLMLISFSVLVFMAGKKYRNDENRYIYQWDTLGVETLLVCGIIVSILLYFLADRVINKLIHILLAQEYWFFYEEMIMYLILYAVAMVLILSFIRSYKQGSLWENSYIKKFISSTKVYSYQNRYIKRLGIKQAVYCLINIGITLFIARSFYVEDTLITRFSTVGLCILLVIFNFAVFHYRYNNAVQRDKIGESIQKIESGELDYKLDTSEFTGRELAISKSINNISEGLSKAIAEQVKSERMKADLITNVSHDIKTPLTSIINYIDLIKRENIDNDNLKKHLKVLEQKSHHLKNLTEDLVEASKVSSGNVSVELMDIDFVEMIQQTNGEFEEKYEEKGLGIVFEVPGDKMLIRADGRHLWRVLENIYSNIYKYALARSRVYMELKEEGETIEFMIKNVSEKPLNISPEELTERFVRGDVARTTEGSGLGLSIAKSLTTLQGGEFAIQIDGDLFKVLLKFRKS